ncbi:anaerobic ribonucleoside-triphosphate reductase activating protein [Candidatus Omnitrophota bacterium]
MIIAGLQNLSLVDYPGHLASVVFVQGCNFRCGYCYNPDLVTLDKHFDFSEEDIFDSITRRKEMIEGVVITGGEPTIYKDLPDFVRRLKNEGFKVKLDTNGSNPAQLEYMLRASLLDYIALDIKTSLPKYTIVTDQKGIEEAVSESIRLTMLSTVPYEFRTTCVPGIVGEEDFRLIAKVTRGAKKYCLQQFRPASTYDKSFQTVQAYSKEDIQNFRSILEGFTEVVEVRGV